MQVVRCWLPPCVLSWCKVVRSPVPSLHTRRPPTLGLPPHGSQRQNDTPPPAVVSAVVPTEPSGRASPEGSVCHDPAALRAACCRGLPPVVQRRAPGTRTHLSHTPVLYSHTPLPPAFLYSSPRLWCCPWPLSRVFPALFVLAHTHTHTLRCLSWPVRAAALCFSLLFSRWV